MQCTVRRDRLTARYFAVDYNLHRHLARVADARPCDIPVRFLIVGQTPDGFVRLYGKVGRRREGHRRSTGGVESHFAGRGARARGGSVHLEIHQVSLAVGHVTAAGLQPAQPTFISQRAI